ncbi:helix-turn-helix domain-containing protein [Glaciimonas sp. GG7]
MSIIKTETNCTVGEALKSERVRLGMNQDDFSSAGGVTKRTQISYEQDERAPDALYLRAVAAIGVDVQYVLTGEQASSALSKDEKELLAGYRGLDIRGKAGVLGMIDGMSDPKQPASSPAFVVHGKVGQQITGGIHAPQTINVGGGKKKKKTIPE